MFYKALGMAVWKLALAYLRQRYGRPLRIAALLGVAAVLAGAIAARSSGDSD
jgi:hypothetical protein